MKALKVIGSVALTAVFFDLFILFGAMYQETQGVHAYWNPFWRTQAEVVVSILK